MSKDTTSTTEPARSLEDYVLLGRSGLRVSPLCLGTMTFGDKPTGLGVGDEESKKIFDLYYEKGGNFFDTANIYCAGQSEQFLGNYVSDKRSNVVVATKYSINLASMMGQKGWNPNVGGNHRKSLVENLDASLKRLNMSYVDILYVHLYEYRTPIEEMMRSLDDVVRSGKSLYIAISDTPAWALARSNTMAELRGWSPFIGLQTRYNLLDRSLESDLEPACAELDVGIIPWGCIAEGFLTGKYKKESSDSKTGIRSKTVSTHASIDKNWEILDEVVAISKEINRSPVQVALNWIEQKPGITAPLIGASSVTQLEENLKSLEFKLTPEQMERLNQVSNPKPHELPFPQSFNYHHGSLFGKTIEMPKKFQAAMNFPKYEMY